MKKAAPVLIVAVLLFGGFSAYQFFAKSNLGPSDTLGTAGVSAEIPEGAHIITLTDKGFEPSAVTIKKGETVAFVTNTKNLFWPASNLHPSHLIYPEFDPQEPVQPDEAWSFTFEKTGEWKFHDHLAPYFTGTITVAE
jgi:plastocyanin